SPVRRRPPGQRPATGSVGPGAAGGCPSGVPPLSARWLSRRLPLSSTCGVSRAAIVLFGNRGVRGERAEFHGPDGGESAADGFGAGRTGQDTPFSPYPPHRSW